MEEASSKAVVTQQQVRDDADHESAGLDRLNTMNSCVKGISPPGS